MTHTEFVWVLDLPSTCITLQTQLISKQTYNFITLFDLPQNTNNDKTRQLHKSK